MAKYRRVKLDGNLSEADAWKKVKIRLMNAEVTSVEVVRSPAVEDGLALIVWYGDHVDLSQHKKLS